MWTARIVLEASGYEDSSFLTLTYEEKALPEKGSLSDEHWREFTKGLGYRYFGCGEYGEHFGRPHYHLVVFGLPAHLAESFAAARWPYGFVSARPFAVEHASYVAGYTVKKMTKADDERLEGRRPEFARMSRRPAIGSCGIVPFQRWMTTSWGVAYVSKALDVPAAVRISGGVYPLGRTLVTKLREACDVPSDLPVRNERRRLRYRIEGSLPELVARKEKRRVTAYERQRARAARRRGVL